MALERLSGYRIVMEKGILKGTVKSKTEGNMERAHIQALTICRQAAG
ncbi:MAG: hypothetical protein ACRERV_08555 [Methylococcales bacterium]